MDKLPVVITKPGKYRMRNGLIAVIEKIDTETMATFNVKGYRQRPNRKRMSYSIWHVSGKHTAVGDHPSDIIEFIEEQ